MSDKQHQHPHISIVSPVYMGEKMVHELVSRIRESVSGITEDFDIILVNDCSPDDSWTMVLKECAEDKRVKGINLSRNFGQHKAIRAGLEFAFGDWVVVMDCDLQDRPEEIVKMYEKAQEGYDIVQGERMERKDKFFKRLSSRLFNAFFSSLSGVKTNNKIANFGVYRQSAIEAVRRIPERDSSFGSLLNQVGFKTVSIPIEHGSRAEGRSSYSLRKLLDLASGFIITNSNKPLRVMVGIGFALSLVSILVALYNVIAYFFGLIKVPGYTTTVFSIWLLGGLIMMQLGIVGIYIGRVFDQVKGRPLYVIRDKVNVEDE